MSLCQIFDQANIECYINLIIKRLCVLEMVVANMQLVKRSLIYSLVCLCKPTLVCLKPNTSFSLLAI